MLITFVGPVTEVHGAVALRSARAAQQKLRCGEAAHKLELSLKFDASITLSEVDGAGLGRVATSSCVFKLAAAVCQQAQNSSNNTSTPAR